MKKVNLSSSSSSSLQSSSDDSLSVLNHLPSTIMILVSRLSAEDREVLGYLITKGKTKYGKNHKPPVFDCECFACYMNYWHRWDSSPNTDIIDEIIEAFENPYHITKEKPGLRVTDSGHNLRDTNPIVETMTETTVSESHLAEAEDDYAFIEKEEAISAVEFPTTATVTVARKVLPGVLGLVNSKFRRIWN